MHVVAREILGYTLMPRIIPRVQSLFRGGFGFIPYSIASVFVMCRLLPANHPYLNPSNIGKFGLRHVLAQAASNLILDKKHMDQIFIYLLMLAGVVLLLLQIGAFMVTSFVHVAKSQTLPLPTTFAGFFESPNPTQDISYIVMDRIFGVPDVFDSCVAQNISCINPANPSDGTFPSPFHTGMHDFLAFYSYGLLIVGTIILCYYITTIISETVMSGTPFGRRFNRVWAPLRLVVALGLLLPMNYNLNAAQYITLYVAKWGSGLGTNAWYFFLASMSTSDTMMGARNTLVGRTQYPGPTEILQFMSIATTCREAYRVMYPTIPIQAYFVRTNAAPGPAGFNRQLTATLSAPTGTPYYSLQEWVNFGDISIVFGHVDPADPQRYKEFKGGVRPYCGELVLDTKRVVLPAGGGFRDGADYLPYTYLLYLVQVPWEGNDPGPNTFLNRAERIARRELAYQRDPAAAEVTKADLEVTLDWFNTTVIPGLVDAAYANMVAGADWTNIAVNYGWGGAASWYNKVAENNGAFADAVFNLPRVVRYPEVMEWIQDEKEKANSTADGANRFEPLLRDGRDIKFANQRDKEILKALNQAYKLWVDDPGTKPAESKNVFIDMINAVFKQTGLWALRDNETVHPFAALTTLGRAMLINSVISFGAGGAAGVMAALSDNGKAKGLLQGASSFMITIAYIGLAVGVMLYYVVPFLPFIYFFFAIVGWAKSIFEAMVGVPLWALAHLRYDGEGFPTRQALTGYYLLMDIFLRPVLIVFGLIASIIIFYAMAQTLNSVFNLVTSNLSGFDLDFAKTKANPGEVGSIEYLRGAVDRMAFTLIYAITIYMIGMSSFKLIDQIPDHILRWTGGGARSFGAMTQSDQGQETTSSIMQGTKVAGDQLTGVAQMLTGPDETNRPRSEAD